MLFEIESIEGPYEGQIFQLREGTEIGRARGQILLKKDSKVSSLHAVVTKDPGGALVLVDQGSSNGLRVNGQKYKRVVLSDGLVVHIGRNVFRVTEKSAAEAAAPVQPQKTWKDLIKEEASKLSPQRLVPKTAVRPFKQKLKLRFIEGIQSDEVMVAGFGPREFGSECLDFEIRESICPPVAFTVAPHSGGALFSTDFPKLVQINSEAESRKELIDGDLIRIGQSLIRVEFE